MSKINPFLYEQMDSWLNRLERCPTKIINFSLLFISLVGGLSNQHQHLPSSSPSTLLYPVFLSAPLPRSINVLLFHTSWIYYFLLIFDFSFSMFEFFFGRFLFGISWDSFFLCFVAPSASYNARTQREATQVRPRKMNLIVVAMNRTWQSYLSSRLLHVPPLFSLHFPFRI